jgi:hypothetical protein
MLNVLKSKPYLHTRVKLEKFEKLGQKNAIKVKHENRGRPRFSSNPSNPLK